MNLLFNRVVFVILLFIFALITFYGGYLIKQAVLDNKTVVKGLNNNPTEIEVDIGKEQIGIKIKTAIPGIVVFVFGVTSLILSLIKVSMKPVIHKKPGHIPEGLEGQVKHLNTLTAGITLPQSDRVEHIPLLLWWLIRNRGTAQRVDYESYEFFEKRKETKLALEEFMRTIVHKTTVKFDEVAYNKWHDMCRNNRDYFRKDMKKYFNTVNKNAQNLKLSMYGNKWGEVEKIQGWFDKELRSSDKKFEECLGL